MKIALILTTLVFVAACDTRAYVEERRARDNFMESVNEMCDLHGRALIQDSRGVFSNHTVYSCQGFITVVPERKKSE